MYQQAVEPRRDPMSVIREVQPGAGNSRVAALHANTSPPASSHPRGLPISLLQHLFSTLLLRGEASNRPDFDLNAVVELLPSHVPHALVGSCNGSVLQGKQTVRALRDHVPRGRDLEAPAPCWQPLGSTHVVSALPITKLHTLESWAG